MNWKRLSFLTKDKIKRLQDKKLKAFIRYQIYPYHPFYKRIFKKNGIDPYSIKTTDDLAKIPFTTKEDIAPTVKEPAKYKDFILQPNEELIKKYAPKVKLIKLLFNKKLVYYEYKPVHIHFTTGRTALPTPFLYSAYDIENLKEGGRRLMGVFGVSKDEIVVDAFPYAPHLAFWQTFFGCTGNLSLQTGGGKIMGSEKIVKAIESMKANVLIAMPGYAYHLIREGVEQKRNFSSLKYLILGGERVPGGLKDKMREMLAKTGSKDNRILSTYAFTEGKVAWAECSDRSGYHLYPDMEFIEIVNENNERVDEGERGEIVYTALDWRGTVVLRYKTGDTARLYNERCENCGRTVARIDADIERKSEFKEFNLTKVKGTLINLNSFFPLLMGHKNIEEWQVEIKKKSRDIYGLDELVVYIAPKAKVDIAKLKIDLKKEIQSEMEITPDIIAMDKEQLLDRLGMETELKEKRIVDKRKK